MEITKIYFELQRDYRLLDSRVIYEDFLDRGLNPKVFWKDDKVTFGFLPWDIVTLPPLSGKEVLSFLRYWRIRLRFDREGDPVYLVSGENEISDFINPHWQSGYVIDPYGRQNNYINPPVLLLFLTMNEAGAITSRYETIGDHVVDQAFMMRLEAFGFPGNYQSLEGYWRK